MRWQLANVVKFSTLVPLALRHYVSVILPLYSLFIYQSVLYKKVLHNWNTSDKFIIGIFLLDYF